MHVKNNTDLRETWHHWPLRMIDRITEHSHTEHAAHLCEQQPHRAHVSVGARKLQRRLAQRGRLVERRRRSQVQQRLPEHANGGQMQSANRHGQIVSESA